MDALFTPQPEGDSVQERLLVESREQLSASPIDRERTIESVAALSFLAVAIAIATLIEAPRTFDLAVAGVFVGAYALSTRVEFRMASGWTDPSQLFFVPMLFLLPTTAVPLLVATALLAARLPDYADGRVHVGRSLLRVADAWYSIWPVLVLLAFGATSPDWSDWPIYVLALASQFAFDGLTTTLRVTYGLGVKARTVLSELRAIYLIDALIAPVGLLVAFGAASQPATTVLLLPLVLLFNFFARERDARIDNALTLSGAYRSTALLLNEVLSTTDEYTGSHSRSVVVLAHQVGQAMGLEEETLRDIEFGALLHDVGKISVPNEVINKPGPLDEEETHAMRRHTVEGERMVSRIGGALGQAGIVVRSHHERYDGTGYPDGLKEAEIPIAARVITACDSFHAMTTNRPYRDAMPLGAALAELRRHAGTQFDPEVVAALVTVVEAWEPAAAPPRLPTP